MPQCCARGCMLGVECLWHVCGECLVCVILVFSICGVCLVSVWCVWYWCVVFCGVCFVNAWGFTNTNERDTLPPGLRVLWFSSGGCEATIVLPAVIQHFTIFFCCHTVKPMTGWSHVEIIHVHHRVTQWSDNTQSFITRLSSDNLVHISEFRGFHLRDITYLHVGWETLKWKPCVSCDYHGVLVDNWVLQQWTPHRIYTHRLVP